VAESSDDLGLPGFILLSRGKWGGGWGGRSLKIEVSKKGKRAKFLGTKSHTKTQEKAILHFFVILVTACRGRMFG
jgi:hypothetical protein